MIHSSSGAPPQPAAAAQKRPFWPIALALSAVAVAAVLYRLDTFDAAALPLQEMEGRAEMVVPKVYGKVMNGAEVIGSGQVWVPEDIEYDPETQRIYTGCADGWLKRVVLKDEVAVEDWVNTGGRPLGVALGVNGELIVADAYKGLLNMTSNGEVKVLSEEADGVKFKLADGVDVAKDGIIYFTDASFKYNLHDFILDVYEGRPHRRFMSFDPETRVTRVLARDLYFANGVQVSPDQKYVVFCETVMRRCWKYIRKGEGKGSVEIFIDNLPGMPDNIKFDGDAYFWIAFSTSVKPYWEMALKYPIIRKGLALVTKHIGRPHMETNGGILAVDLDGNPTAHYYDPSLYLISGGNKIGEYLYFGSLHYPFILRLNLTQYPLS